MMEKDQKWDWTENQEKAFQELKEKFMKELVLAVPDLKKNEDRSKCIRLCYERDSIYRV